MMKDYLYFITGSHTCAQQLLDIMINFSIKKYTLCTAIQIYNHVCLILEDLRNKKNGYDFSKVIKLKHMCKTKYLMLAICFLISHKYHNDISYENKLWAKALKIDIKSLNRLEKEFLNLLEHRLNFTGDDIIIQEIESFLEDESDSIFKSDNAKKKKCKFIKLFCF